MRKSLSEIWRRLAAPSEAVAAWCTRWRIVKFGVYGSALYRHFAPGSDINVLVSFARDVGPADEEWGTILAEAETLFHRPVTIADEARLEDEASTFKRISILGTVQTLYHRRGTPEEPDTVEMEILPEDFVLSE